MQSDNASAASGYSERSEPTGKTREKSVQTGELDFAMRGTLIKNILQWRVRGSQPPRQGTLGARPPAILLARTPRRILPEDLSGDKTGTSGVIGHVPPTFFC